MLNINFYQVLLKGILYVEASFKTKLAYLISREFGTESGEDIDNPRNNFFYQGHYDVSNPATEGILRTLRSKLKFLLSDTRSNSYSHKFLTSKKQLPPWMFVHDIEFGLAIQWYHILREADREEICSKMMWGESASIPPGHSPERSNEFFNAALELLREYRNTIAHGERVFSSEMTSLIPEEAFLSLLPQGLLSPSEYRQGIGQKDTFACLLALVIFVHDPLLMLSFLTEIRSQLDFAGTLRQTMAPGSLDIYQILGIPPFTMDRLVLFSHHRFGQLSHAYFD